MFRYTGTHIDEECKEQVDTVAQPRITVDAEQGKGDKENHADRAQGTAHPEQSAPI